MLPEAALNLFDRARIRIRGERMGLESVSLTGGRLVFMGVDVPKKVAFDLKSRLGATVFPKSRKLSVPCRAGAGTGSDVGRGINVGAGGVGAVQAALAVICQLGATGDDD